MAFDKVADKAVSSSGAKGLEHPKKKLADLEKEVDAQAKRHAKLIQDRKALHADQKKDLKHQVDYTQLRRLEAIKDGYAATIKKLDSEIKDLKTKLVAAERDLKAAQALRDKADRTYKGAAPQVTKDTTRRDLAEKAHTATLMDLRKAERTKDKAQIDKAKAAEKTAKQAIADADKAVKKGEAILKKIDDERDEALAKHKAAEDETKRLKKALVDDIAEFKKTAALHAPAAKNLNDERDRLSALADKVDDAGKELAEIEKQIKALEKEQFDSSAELVTRRDAEKALAATVAAMRKLFDQIDAAVGSLEAEKPPAPPVADKASKLRAALNKLEGQLKAIEPKARQDMLAAEAANIKTLLRGLNAVADGAQAVIDEAPGLRNDHFSAALQTFADDTIKANLSKQVGAGDIKIKKLLKTETEAAVKKGWTQAAINAAEKTLGDEIKRQAKAKEEAEAEKTRISALADDPTYKNLKGRVIVVAEERRKDGATYATVKAEMDRLLANQRKPSVQEWTRYLQNKGVKIGNHPTGNISGGRRSHVTIMAGFLSNNAAKINLATDSPEQAMDKLFKLSDESKEIHSTLESDQAINRFHYYYGGRFGVPAGGGDHSAIKSELKKKLDKWLEDKVKPLIVAAKDKDGNFDIA